MAWSSSAASMGAAPYDSRRSADRSNSAKRGCSITRLIMVGTKNISVTRADCKVCSTASSSNIGTTCTGTSRSTLCSAMPQPATWNMGAATMATASCVSRGNAATVPSALMHRLPCVSITPLGWPVVPPVYMTAASSSLLCGASSMGVASASKAS
jgi:hypothetical protein